MKLHHVNLVGVLLLAALCVGQWRRDRELNLEINRLERLGQAQAARVAEQDKLLRDVNGDLTQFKENFSRSEADLKATRQQLRLADREFRQLAAERDQLKTSVTNWAAAVTVRDERLQEAVAQVQRLAEELNGSLRKFNELATKHNAVVKDLNELRTRLAKPEPAAKP